MYICICKAVTERQIHSAVAQGAQRMRDLHERLGVAGQCGRCATCAHQCLKSALNRQQDVQKTSPAVPSSSELIWSSPNERRHNCFAMAE
jgi:bacterioferritin-associated ferredoxin